jgi:hypothetical protein
MPSVSPAQRKLMAIAAHTPGGYGGVPQSVGVDFHSADRGKYGAMTTSGKPKTPKPMRTFGQLATKVSSSVLPRR